MKKYTWIVALLLALSLAFFGCGGGGDDDDDDGDDGKKTEDGDDEGGGFKILAELGEFKAGNGTTQRGWARDDPAAFDKTAWNAATYLVLELVVPDPPKNADGYGGIVFILNSTSLGGYTETKLNGDWLGFSRTAGDTHYLVIAIKEMDGYKQDLIDEGFLQVLIAHYSDNVADLGYKTAYLVDDKGAKPAGAVNLASAEYGYICKDLVLTP